MHINVEALIRRVTAIAALLILLSIAGQFSKYVLGHGYLKGLVPLFYVDAEANLPTFFSVLLLLATSTLLLMCASLGEDELQRHRLHWFALAAGFGFMAYDEAFQVHERLNTPMRELLGGAAEGYWFYAWVVPAMLLVTLVGLLFTRFLRELPALTRNRFLVAAALYLGGALVLEMVGGRHAELYGQENLAYSLIATVEETLEIAGLITFLRALMLHVAGINPALTVRFG